jgi:hypothetical protein
MPIIYVIEQLIDKRWVGVKTNFFNTTKNSNISPKMETALDSTSHVILGESHGELKQSDMVTLLNSLSPYLPRTISIHEYKAIAFKNTHVCKRNRIVLDHLTNGKGINEIIGMPPEFDVDKMRFVWWDGDYARTPPCEREYG